MSGVPIELLQSFAAKFGGAPRVFSAPGRVNLIGEHTDYNEGFVFPIAIEQRTYVAARARVDELVVVHSLAKHEDGRFDLAKPGARRRNSWLDYVEGTAQALRSRGHQLRGVDMALWSDVPVGAGLSSSAALEVAVGLALVSLAGEKQPDPVELALAGQAAEHEYVGTLCGIMDQFAAALSRPGCALLIDCRSLEARAVPLELGSATLLVCDTRVKHRLADSAYNQRRRECQEGLELLKHTFPEIRSLRDLDLSRLSRAALPELALRRCRHVISENERTLRAADALSEGRIADVGALMSQSHESLRDDYEVSCVELDEAVATARAQPGVYGARMTGGGFGGCTITLAERDAIPHVREAIERRFAERFDTAPAFFTSRASGGAREDAVGRAAES
jgi:galactokinase